MITNSARGWVLANLGWVDKGSIWRYHLASGKQDHVVLSESSYLSLASQTVQSIAVKHGMLGRTAISVQGWDTLDVPSTTVDVRGWTAEVSGDLAEFAGHQRLHVHYLDEDATGAPGYFLIDVGSREVRVRRLDWFTDDHYDLMYQQVLGALELPTGEYLFGIQRSSNLVLSDPETLEVIREVPLGEWGGNPMPFMRGQGSELWAVDYDTLVRLDPQTMAVTDKWLGQPADDPWVPHVLGRHLAV